MGIRGQSLLVYRRTTGAAQDGQPPAHVNGAYPTFGYVSSFGKLSARDVPTNGFFLGGYALQYNIKHSYGIFDYSFWSYII